MSRKRIITLAVAAIILVMVGAPIYQAFDIHDMRSMTTDPELMLVMLGSLLALCLSTVVLTVRLLNFCFSSTEPLPLGRSALGSRRQCLAFEVGRLLFSPPLSVTSLRI
jgi:uncharacterized membrane protein YjgN (DUF898 family)